MRIAAAFLLILLVSGTAQAECLITDKAAPNSAPQFATYPAKAWSGHPATLVITGKSAKLFRTQLREQAPSGPDFAGHYKIAQWGCGAGCVDWAVIDSQTGAVTFTKAWEAYDRSQSLGEVLAFRRDSRLLIIEGGPSENPNDGNTGLTYLLWSGKSFKKLAFYPQAKACLQTDTSKIP
ncbi:MAG TPA: hypothetical protein VG839_00505 [Asticcacaulis sp.]|nr:hypothetical protein [Asticcacaulis sp.]